MGGGCSSSSSSRLSVRTLLGTIIIVLGFIILVMSVGIVQITEGNKTTSSTTIKTSGGQSTPTGKLQYEEEQVKVLGRGKPDLNYMSKRGVPKGPDPIHNRRAGNSRRPPGQT